MSPPNASWFIAVCLLFPLGIPSAEELAFVPKSTARVCQLTGDFDRATKTPTLSETGKRFGLTATDLGSSFEHKGKLYFLFGDTWGRPGDRDVIAWTDATDPAKIVLDFHKARDNKWSPLTVPGVSQGAFEVPSGGISIKDVIYLVCTTDHTEAKTMGRSVVARSEDDGRTCKALYELSRSKFINVSLVNDGEWLYVYGSGDFRKSDVYLARVKPGEFTQKSKLTYFAGHGPGDQPRWLPREADAAPLFHQPQVGEFSVAWIKDAQRYVMLYNASEPRGITMRSSTMPWGPWSDGAIVFDPAQGYGHFMHVSSKVKKDADKLSDPQREEEWGGEYGPYLMPRFTTKTNGHHRIFYTMSTWNPYQVVIMRSDLELKH